MGDVAPLTTDRCYSSLTTRETFISSGRWTVCGTRRGDIGVAVVQAVADAKGVDPGALTPPLGHVINPDALDRLFDARNPTTGHVTFQYSGYEVTVRSDGQIRVTDGQDVQPEADSPHNE
ncbi:MAG: HalOD1 output domain-containing protein [Haloferacaceae archaeon]